MIARDLSYKFTKLRAVLLGGLGLAAISAGAAQAYTWQDWMNQKTMTGNWNGGRTRLAADGVDFTAGYVGELASSASGGKRQGSDVASQFYYGFKADLGKLAGLNGTTLTVGFNSRVGRNTSADYTGNKLAVQEVYGAGETTRIVEVSLTQKLFHDQVELKGGFYPMGNDFAGIAYGCDFQNVGFCAHPQNLPNSSGWSDNPTGKWGGRVKLNFTPDAYLEAGIYDVNPTYGNTGNGLKMSTSGSTGALIPVEAAYKTHFGGLPGEYKIGAYYDTSDAASVTNASDIQNGRYGFYAIGDQMLMSFGGPKRGLIAIAMVSYSDPSTALFQGSVLGGLEARGPFAARPNDYINVGYVRAIINHRAIDAKEAASHGTLTDLSTGEGVIEAGYGFQAAPWWIIHPNVQYVMDPGTFSYKHYANAWVFGLETKLSF